MKSATLGNDCNSVDIDIEVRSGTVGFRVGLIEISNTFFGLYNFFSVLFNGNKSSVFILLYAFKSREISFGGNVIINVIVDGELARIENSEFSASEFSRNVVKFGFSSGYRCNLTKFCKADRSVVKRVAETSDPIHWERGALLFHMRWERPRNPRAEKLVRNRLR